MSKEGKEKPCEAELDLSKAMAQLYIWGLLSPEDCISWKISEVVGGENGNN